MRVNGKVILLVVSCVPLNDCVNFALRQTICLVLGGNLLLLFSCKRSEAENI